MMAAPNEEKHESEANALETAVQQMLQSLGEDCNREGLRDTPKRVARSMKFLTSGYRQDPTEVMGDAIFHEKYDEMVVVRNIDFYSLCEHHLLPFHGKAHVAYLPNGKIIGLSKIPRLVELYARRLQVQERLTEQIAQSILDLLDPLGTAVVLEGFHMCMAMRGVQQQNAWMTTSAVRGIFKTDNQTRQEFLRLIRGISHG
jgi:GTP cyclohydrolase I